MNNLYCDMDGVLVDFVAGATKLVNDALKEPELYKDIEAFERLVQKLDEQGKQLIEPVDLEKPEYRGINEEDVMPEARELMKYLIARAGADWWQNLPWTPDGRDLWNHLKENYDPYILSAPMSGCAGCEEGKIEWVKNNLGLPVNKIILTDEKYVYAKDNILIDDFEINLIPWAAAGGTAVKHVFTHETVKELTEVYGNE
jgi:5'(3')-deoxyribonucleotidase